MKLIKGRLLLLVDIEFTDFIDMELISLRIRSRYTQTFYAENTEFNESLCNDYVRQEVLNRLQGGKCAMPYKQLKKKLYAWISELLNAYSHLVCVCDSSDERMLLKNLLIDYPEKEKVELKSSAHDVECDSREWRKFGC